MIALAALGKREQLGNRALKGLREQAQLVHEDSLTTALDTSQSCPGEPDQLCKSLLREILGPSPRANDRAHAGVEWLNRHRRRIVSIKCMCQGNTQDVCITST